VDIAQEVYVARAVNFRGIIVGDPLSFNNNEEGFARLLQWMNQLKTLKGFDSTIVGMEPTGHYWINLSKWLYEQDIEVVTANPHLVKKNKALPEYSQNPYIAPKKSSHEDIIKTKNPTNKDKKKSQRNKIKWTPLSRHGFLKVKVYSSFNHVLIVSVGVLMKHGIIRGAIGRMCKRGKDSPEHRRWR
jgi:hypothetical protein